MTSRTFAAGFCGSLLFFVYTFYDLGFISNFKKNVISNFKKNEPISTTILTTTVSTLSITVGLKIEKISIFCLKMTILGLILCGKSIAHIPEA